MDRAGRDSGAEWLTGKKVCVCVCVRERERDRVYVFVVSVSIYAVMSCYGSWISLVPHSYSETQHHFTGATSSSINRFFWLLVVGDGGIHLLKGMVGSTSSRGWWKPPLRVTRALLWEELSGWPFFIPLPFPVLTTSLRINPQNLRRKFWQIVYWPYGLKNLHLYVVMRQFSSSKS